MNKLFEAVDNCKVFTLDESSEFTNEYADELSTFTNYWEAYDFLVNEFDENVAGLIWAAFSDKDKKEWLDSHGYPEEEYKQHDKDWENKAFKYFYNDAGKYEQEVALDILSSDKVFSIAKKVAYENILDNMNTNKSNTTKETIDKSNTTKETIDKSNTTKKTNELTLDDADKLSNFTKAKEAYEFLYDDFDSNIASLIWATFSDEDKTWWLDSWLEGFDGEFEDEYGYPEEEYKQHNKDWENTAFEYFYDDANMGPEVALDNLSDDQLLSIAKKVAYENVIYNMNTDKQN